MNYENVIDCHRIDSIRVAIIELIFYKSVDSKRATSFRFYIYVEIGAYATVKKIIHSVILESTTKVHTHSQLISCMQKIDL
jgi:hypothetical protein